MVRYAVLLGVAAAVCLLATPLVCRLALALGAVDIPGQRRIHSQPTPRLGGLAIYLSLLITFAVAAVYDRAAVGAIFASEWRVLALLAGATSVLIVGALDDCLSLSPLPKLAVEILAGGLAVAAGYRIDTIFGITLGWLAIPATIGWVVAIINGVNLIDGLDGLVAGTGLLVCGTLFAIAEKFGNPGAAILPVVLGGALLGFLRYNFHPARIFLGDSGSLLVGFILAVAAIGGSSKSAEAAAILIPVLVLGLPLLEVGLTVARRTLRVIRVVRSEGFSERYRFEISGRPKPFTADRAHIHHRLIDRGVTHVNAVLMLYAAGAVLGAGAFVLASTHASGLALLVAAIVIAGIVAVRVLRYEELRPLNSGLLLPLFDSPILRRAFLYVLFDAFAMVLAYGGASLIHSGGDLSGAAQEATLRSLPVVVLVQLACFALSSLYRRTFRQASVADVLAVGKCLLLAVVVTWAVQQALAFAGYAPAPALAVAILDAYVLATLILAFRFSFRILDHLFRRSHTGGRRTVIYGAGNAGAMALDEISHNDALGLSVVAVVDDDPIKWQRSLHGILIRSPKIIDELIAARALDEVIVASSKIDQWRVTWLARRCGRAGVPVRRFHIGLNGVEQNGLVIEGAPAPRPADRIASGEGPGRSRPNAT